MGGYICLVLGIFWALGRQPRPSEQFRANHGWPVASAVVKSLSQRSRMDVERKHKSSVPVYGMEFTVLLDLPLEQCPPPMRTTFRGVAGCFGTYNTVWTDSAKENWEWGSRHPVLSTVQVHYDPTGKSGSVVFFAGEPWADAYPWREYIFGLFMVFMSFLCFLAARSATAKAEMGESGFPEERASLGVSAR